MAELPAQPPQNSCSAPRVPAICDHGAPPCLVGRASPRASAEEDMEIAASLLPTSHILAFFNEDDVPPSRSGHATPADRAGSRLDPLDAVISTEMCRVSLLNGSRNEEAAVGDGKQQSLTGSEDASIAIIPGPGRLGSDGKADSLGEAVTLGNGVEALQLGKTEILGGIDENDCDEKLPCDIVATNGIESKLFDMEKLEDHIMSIPETDPDKSLQLDRNKCSGLSELEERSDSDSDVNSDSDSDSDSDNGDDEEEEEEDADDDEVEEEDEEENGKGRTEGAGEDKGEEEEEERKKKAEPESDHDSSSLDLTVFTKSQDVEAESEFEEGELKESPTKLNNRKSSAKQRKESFAGDSSDDDAGNLKESIQSKYEKNLPPVPKVSITLEPHHMMSPAGIISSVLGSTLIVEGTEGQTALNEGSILWLTDKRLALGIIDELFGPVKKPFYLVRYNTPEEIPEEAQEGVNVSYVQEFADFALSKPELYSKGYDAFDEELSDSEIEFSDDEKEAEYWRSKGHVKREREAADSEDWFPSGRKGEDDPCRKGNKKNSRTRGNRKDSQVNNDSFGRSARQQYQHHRGESKQHLEAQTDLFQHDCMGRPPRHGYQLDEGESMKLQTERHHNDFCGRPPSQQYRQNSKPQSEKHSLDSSRRPPPTRQQNQQYSKTPASKHLDSSGRPPRHYQQKSKLPLANQHSQDSSGRPSRNEYPNHVHEDVQQSKCMADMVVPAYESTPLNHQVYDVGQYNLSESGRQTSVHCDGLDGSQTHHVQGSRFLSPSYSQRPSHLPVQDHLQQVPGYAATGIGIPMGASPLLQFGIPGSNLPLQQPRISFSNQVPAGLPFTNQPQEPRVESVQGWPTPPVRSTDHTGAYMCRDIQQPQSQLSSTSSSEHQKANQVFVGIPSHNQVQSANVVGGVYHHHNHPGGVQQQAHAFDSAPVLGVPAMPQAVASFNQVSQGACNQNYFPSAAMNSSTGFNVGSPAWAAEEQFPPARTTSNDSHQWQHQQEQRRQQQHNSGARPHQRKQQQHSSSPQDRSPGFPNTRNARSGGHHNNGRYSGRRY